MVIRLESENARVHQTLHNLPLVKAVNILLFQIFLQPFQFKKGRRRKGIFKHQGYLFSTEAGLKFWMELQLSTSHACPQSFKHKARIGHCRYTACFLTSSREKTDFLWQRADPNVSMKTADAAQEHFPELFFFFLPGNAIRVCFCAHCKEQGLASLCGPWVMRPKWEASRSL